MQATSAVLFLLLYDLVFLAVLFAVMMYLKQSKPVAFAVLKRNFMGYFSNPTGYVFLCLFVLLTSMAAFWPHEFFGANMGTLDQLNYWFPIIMLFFIPAITMSIWADERRQGTDELLLTLPADDFDIVVGKYLSAASIYTASLMFSQLSTFTVLCTLTLGDVDTGLFWVNYFGYWFIGLAMIAIGMVASFLSNNLTVGFILGALFNAPLAFASMADVISSRDWARPIASWGLVKQFDSFGRGVISLAAVAYFLLVAILGIYLCMVLIGRRHWSGGKDGNARFLHYLARVLLIVCIVGSASFFFRNNDRRIDATEGKVSSLSPVTMRLVRELDSKNPIVVDAYLSADVPELYAKTKYDLLSLLKEFEAVAKRSGIPLEVNIYDNLEVFSEEARSAENAYGIVPVNVRYRDRGAIADKKVLLGAAFRSGLEKVIVPFFEYGVPVEYEVIRSLRTVAQSQRKKLGIVKNETQFMGGFSMSTMQQVPQQAIIAELAKQYDVKEADLSAPLLPDQFDVLMVVQPSLLGPQEMANLVAAVQSGIPTALFEDPLPFGFSFPGTAEPKQAPGGPFGGGGGALPKGDMGQLLEAIGVNMPGAPSGMGALAPSIVWQRYNPYPKLTAMDAASDEWIFVREEAPGAMDVLSESSEITKELREVMLMYAGTVVPVNKEKFNYVELLATGEESGTIPYAELNTLMQSGQGSNSALRQLQGAATGRQILALQIEGKAAKPAETKPADAKAADAKEGEKKEETPAARPVRAVFVADTDCMNPIFIEIRSRPEQFEEVDFRFQNVSFLLNVIDVLAGEDGYPAVRRHEPQHSTLRLIEQQADIARSREMEQRRTFQASYDKALQDAEAENTKSIKAFEAKVEKLQKDKGNGRTIERSKVAELQEALTQMDIERQRLTRKLAVKKEQLERERDRNIETSRLTAENEIINTQTYYKQLAIFLPPIPPLLVGIGVFVSRRLREREGIPKSRLI